MLGSGSSSQLYTSHKSGRCRRGSQAWPAPRSGKARCFARAAEGDVVAPPIERLLERLGAH